MFDFRSNAEKYLFIICPFFLLTDLSNKRASLSKTLVRLGFEMVCVTGFELRI